MRTPEEIAALRSIVLTVEEKESMTKLAEALTRGAAGLAAFGPRFEAVVTVGDVVDTTKALDEAIKGFDPAEPVIIGNLKIAETLIDES